METPASLKHINTSRTPPNGGNVEDACIIVDGMPDKQQQPLSPWSKAFHDPAMNMYILAIIGSQTPLDENRGKALISQLIHKHHRFASVVGGDRRKDFEWVKISKLQSDHHLVVPVIDSASITPGSKMADKYVEDYMHNLSKERFDKSSRPMWDLHFLKLKTTKEEGVIIFRAHHSLGDGASLMSLLLGCSYNVSDPTTLPKFPVSNKSSRQEEDGGIMRNCWRVLVWLWWVLILLWNSSVDGLKFLATICFLKDTNTPLKGRSCSALSPRRFVYRTLRLDDIKLVKNIMNVTINDVAIGITQAGLSCYLNRKCTEDHGATNNKKKKTNKPPKNIRLRSTLMVNLRPQQIQVSYLDHHPIIANLIRHFYLNMNPHSLTHLKASMHFQDFSQDNTKLKWGNLMGLFLLPFNISFRDDPLDYVREAKVTAARKKHSLESNFTFWSLKIIPMLFGFKVLKAVIERVCANTTLTFSNVVGPTDEILFCGHRINVIAATCYGQTQASMITFTSCGNQMALVASVDEDTISDPQQLCDDIVESFRLIKEAAVKQHI